jgi:opacity protein-like surface antigen
LRRTFFALVGSAVSLVCSPAHEFTACAADLLPPAPVIDDADDSVTSGWYLRGDIGAAEHGFSHEHRDFGFDSAPSLIRSRFDRQITAGVGAGYQFSPWFRTDLTIDHGFESAFEGTRLTPTSGFVLDRANFSATTFLANLYVDLPLWSGVTPYFSVGIGFSRNRFDDGERGIYRADGTLTGIEPLAARTMVSVAWALMTGIVFDLTSNLKLDLGYRYDHLGRGAARGPSIDGLSDFHADISAHELRIGTRYLFD